MALDTPQPAAPPGQPRTSWWWNPNTVVFTVLGLTSLAILIVMSGADVRILSSDGFPFFEIDIRGGPSLFSATTPTGGDMGAHVYVPAYLRDTLLPQGRLIGWSNDWYAGFPVLYFYFPLPALTIVALDVVLPYGVAFKLVTIAGLLALPWASYFLVRSMQFPKSVAMIAGVAGGTFVFMESHTIFGGNIPATLAGEYSFSWSLALSLVYFGLIIRATREGKVFTPLAAVVLALAALSHLVTTLVVILASIPLLFRKNWRTSGVVVVTTWAIGFAIAAFWAIPLLLNLAFTTDMGWDPVNLHRTVDGIRVNNVFPREMLIVAILGFIGFGWSLLRRFDVIPALFLAAIPVAGFFVIAASDYTKLYNARLLPFWYFTMYLFAGIALGLALVEVVRRVANRDRVLMVAGAGVAVFVLVVGLVGISFAGGWARWNYTGYEGKDGWSEYSALMETLGALPGGRVMWEANSEMNRYGTPMALMLTPYWTEGDNPSMEGLLFESSVTTPFHFLNAAEVSEKPSNPVRGLNYHNKQFDRALRHLPLFDIRYYVSFTDEAAGRAAESLEVVAEVDPFTVFELPESSLVDVATYVPAVYEGDDFFEASLNWYDDVTRLDQWLVADGPDSWPRVADPEFPYAERPQEIETTGTVSNVVLEDDRISFTTTAVGVPHLVKVSYFPNWTAAGAEGPYRAAPSLMVVIPTEEDVVISFEYTWAERFGWLLTFLAVGGLIGYGVHRWRRSRQPAEPDTEHDAVLSPALLGADTWSVEDLSTSPGSDDEPPAGRSGAPPAEGSGRGDLPPGEPPPG
jgi:hypothetical protein